MDKRITMNNSAVIGTIPVGGLKSGSGKEAGTISLEVSKRELVAEATSCGSMKNGIGVTSCIMDGEMAIFCLQGNVSSENGITISNVEKVGTILGEGLKIESALELPSSRSLQDERESTLCNVSDMMAVFDLQSNAKSETGTTNNSEIVGTLFSEVVRSESVLEVLPSKSLQDERESTFCHVNSAMAVFDLQNSAESETGTTNNGKKVGTPFSEVVRSESVLEVLPSKNLQDEREATSSNISETMAVFDPRCDAESEIGIIASNSREACTILAQVAKSDSGLVVASGSLKEEVVANSLNLIGTMAVFDSQYEAKSETGITASNRGEAGSVVAQVVKSESALEVESWRLKEDIGATSCNFSGTTAVFDLQGSAKSAFGIIADDKEVAITLPGVIKSEWALELPSNERSSDGTENIPSNEDDETNCFQGEGMLKFEKIDSSTKLAVKIKKENEDESVITHDLVGHFSRSKAEEDQKAALVVKREHGCGSVKEENISDVYGNCFDSPSSVFAVNKGSVSETYKKSYGRFQTQSKIHQDSNSLKLLNVLVKLEDLFPSHLRKLGEAHSNHGSCLCIYCRGEFRYTSDSRRRSARKRKIQLSEENSTGKYRNQVKKEQGAVKVEAQNNESQFQCEKCSRKFKNRYILSIHLRVHSGDNLYPCTLCPRKFPLISSLDYHYKVHYDDKPFLCKQCPAKFTHLSRLELHLRSHSNDQPFTCNQCSAKFKQKSSLKVHARVHKDQRPFRCSKCTASFKFRCNLNVHLRVHSGEKRFKCTLCSRKFMTNTNLKNHIRVHSGERPYKCKQCPLRFVQSSCLGSHVKNIHSDERPFACEFCAKKFKWRTALKTHVRVHTGERPYKCNLCPLGFAQSSSLNGHMKNVHNDARMFKCQYCPKKFTLSSRLKSHLEIHRPGEVLSCAHCSASFKLKLNMIRHLKQFH